MLQDNEGRSRGDGDSRETKTPGEQGIKLRFIKLCILPVLCFQIIVKLSVCKQAPFRLPQVASHGFRNTLSHREKNVMNVNIKNDKNAPLKVI